MQVEHKTEKGTVCFLKIEDDAFDVKLTESKLYEYDFVNFKTPHRWDNFKKRNWRWGTHFEVGKWQLIGLTSEVTESQCKWLMHIEGFKGYDNFVTREIEDKASDSFKSLMQHLQVYEVNPWIEIINGEDTDWEVTKEQFEEAKSRSGKWIVLFKPN